MYDGLNASAMTPQITDDQDEAMRKLVDGYYPLIQVLASRIQCMYAEKEVLIQAGTLGLLKALKHFQPDRGVKLSTYAVPWILGEMKRALRQEVISCGSLSLDESASQEDGSSLLACLGAAGIDLSMIDLHLAFEKLDPQAQLLILLRYFRGKTQKEASVLLKKSQAQISRMERQALDALHALLA